MPEAHILVTFPDPQSAAEWLCQPFVPDDVQAELIVVDPNAMYDNEYQFATMPIFPDIVTATAETLEEEGLVNAGQWPELPAEQWREQDAYALVHLAVTRWGYLGHNGSEAMEIEDSWRKGELQNLGRRSNPDD